MPRKKHRLKTHETGTSLLLDFEDAEQPYRDRSPAGHTAIVVGDPRVVKTTR